MTEHDQRIAIAEWMGWQDFHRDCLATSPNGQWMPTPDYTRDLNAMHEAEHHLADVNQLNEYADQLDKVCVPTHICSLTHWQAVAMATAAQRCEALLRTIGKWQDSP